MARGASPDPVVARVDGRAVHQSAVDQARAEARLDGRRRRRRQGARRRHRSRARACTKLSGSASRPTRPTSRAGRPSWARARRRRGLEVRAAEGGDERGSVPRERCAAGVLREAVQNARFPQVKAGRRRRATLLRAQRADALHAVGRGQAGRHRRARTKASPGMPSSACARVVPSTKSHGSSASIPRLKDAGGSVGLGRPHARCPSRLAQGGRAPARVGPRLSEPVAGPGRRLGRQGRRARGPDAWPRSRRCAPSIEDGLAGRKRSAALAEWLDRGAQRTPLIERL